jgi:hypothetical protein
MIRSRDYFDNVTIQLDPVTGAAFVAGAPPADPLQIFGQAGLRGWWQASRADDPASLVPDSSGNGKNAVQPTAGRRPPLVVGAFGNRALTNAGGPFGLDIATLAIGAGDRPSVFLIVEPSAAGVLAGVFDDPGNVFSPTGGIFQALNGGAFGWFAAANCSDGYSGSLGDAVPTVGGLQVFELAMAPTGCVFRRNGATLGLSAKVGGTNSAMPRTYIISPDPAFVADSGQVAPWNGLWYETIITSAQPTAAQRARLNAYLLAKYGVAVL